MALYQYVKAQPTKKRKRKPIIISYLLMACGTAIILWVLWPIASFTVITAPLLSSIISPIRETATVDKRVGILSPLVLAAGTGQVEESTGVDFTNANVWFPTQPQKKVVTPVNTYTLSIPKLKISSAMATIAGDDLNKSLVHYGGTGLPGEYGTSVIFGHSVLPQFYNPTSYKTIFSTLPSLAVGDDIYVTYDGIEYTYRVFDSVVTEPSDLTPLAQRFDDSYITLITCVPPGTYWKRLNVHARLERP